MDLIDIWKQLFNRFLRCNLFYGIQFVNQEAIILYKDVVCWQSWTFLVRYLCSVWLQTQTSFFSFLYFDVILNIYMYFAVIIVEMALTKTLNLYMLQNILPMCSKYVSFFHLLYFVNQLFYILEGFCTQKLQYVCFTRMILNFNWNECQFWISCT